MKAKFIYEKFIEDSDPIKDLRIGRIKFIDFYKQYKEDIKKWQEFLNQFIGKNISGTMLLFTKNFGNWSNTNTKIKIYKIDVGKIEDDADNIFVEAGNGFTYILDLYEEYLIED